MEYSNTCNSNMYMVFIAKWINLVFCGLRSRSILKGTYKIINRFYITNLLYSIHTY